MKKKMLGQVKKRAKTGKMNEEKEKKNLIVGIMGMTEYIDIQQDETDELINEEYLAQKTLDELITLFEEIMKEADNALKVEGNKNEKAKT